MKHFGWMIMLLAGVSASAALPENDTYWVINPGESEVVPAGSALTSLTGLVVNGSLDVQANQLDVQMPANTMVQIGAGAGTNGTLTVSSGGKLVVTGTATSPTSGTPSFSVGVMGGTGTVTVATGGSLVVTNASLMLGRNGWVGTASFDRSARSTGILNVNGSVWATRMETTAWYPQAESAKYGTYVVDDQPVGAIINLNEGGVLEVLQYIQHDDTAVTVVNCNGGTFRVPSQDSNWISIHSSPIQFRIAEGKSWIIDTPNHVRMNKATVQTDFLTISGAGGLVKKGAGYLQFGLSSAANTFTGPIVVEAGWLSLGRPLAEGQTVTVKKGAVFYPRCGADLAKITWEDPSEAITAKENQVFIVPSNYIEDGVDLPGLAPYYRTDAIGSDTWGWGGSVIGKITHGDVSFAHPFELVGGGGPLAFTGTDLDQVPLRLTGTPSTFTFNGNRTNTTDSAIFFATNATYAQGNTIHVMGADGTMPKLTISGKGTLAVTDNIAAGYSGCDGEVLIESNANVTVTHLRIGATAGGRESTKGKVTIDHATLTTSGYVYFASSAPTTGEDYETLMAEMELNEGAVLKVGERIHRNDDPRSRLTFNGGVIYPQKSYADFFYSGQNGIFEIVAGTGDIALNLASYTIGLYDNHIHVFGDRGLSVTGTKGGSGTLVLGITGVSDFSVDYKGDTTLTDATLRIGMETLDLSDTTHGVVTGTRGVLDLYGHTAQVRNVTGTDMKVVGPGTLELGLDNADITTTASISDATLVKSGTGTLALANGFDGTALDVREGTVAVSGSTPYRSYRFMVESSRSEGVCMQLSELILWNGNVDVTRPYADLAWETASDCGQTFPAKEAPANLVDGSTSTKWLDYRAGTSRSAADKKRAWLRINYAQPTLVTAYTWFTANDYSSRDPAAWRLQGSNDDGATWVDLDVRTGMSPTTTRYAAAGSYPCCGSLGADVAVTVAEGATLQVAGALPLGQLVNNGTVTLAEGAAIASTGGALDATGVTGAGSLEVSSGSTTLVGTGAYTGDTHVTGGTLNLGQPATKTTRTFDGKFFRLTITRSNGGNSNSSTGLATDYSMQFSEFQLYGTNGVNQVQGLTRATSGTAAALLSAGTYATDADYAHGNNEDVPNVFDGKTATKWYCGTAINGTVANRLVITMRLAASAPPIASYNFYTANDNVRRSPSDWTLEGSYDGLNWETLDTRHWAPHTAFSDKKKYADSSIQYKPFNNGTNFTFTDETPVPYAGRYYRFTFQKTVTSTMLQLSELGLVDIAGNNLAKGLTLASVGAAANTLAAGTFTKNVAYPNNSEDAVNLFDDNPNTKLCTGGSYAVNGSNKYIITLRLADGTLPVVGYYLTTANDGLGRSPSDWTVEGSEDGETWTTLDAHTGVTQPFCLFTSMNGGALYNFASYAPATALPADSVLQVDAGTVNVNAETATIANLRIDCDEAGGTINGFRAAANGVLEIVNVPADTSIYDCELPLAFTNVADATNLKTWKVKIDGKVRAGVAVKLVDGKLKLASACTMIFVR